MVITIPSLFLIIDKLMMLQRFLRICREPILDFNDTTAITSQNNIVKRVYRKQTEGGIDFQVDALILPQGMI